MVFSLFRLYLSINIEPLLGSINLSINEKIVLLPAPEGPTKAIILPLSMPGVIGAVLIIFIPCIGDYITPKLVGGPEGLMIANMIQVQFSKANNAPLAAALSVTSLLIVGVISIVFVLLNRKYLRNY